MEQCYDPLRVGMALVWLALACAVAWMGHKKGQSIFLLWFISIVFTPLAGLFVVLFMDGKGVALALREPRL